MFGLTGCANIEVSQDKFDSMIETVEKADNRLDEYIDLLEQQNQQLQEQNTNLENLLEEASRMTKEEVWNLAQTADFNLMMNVNSLRDNCVMTAINEELGLSQDIMLYYNSDSMSVYAALDGDGKVSTGVELWYQTNETNVVMADIDKVGNEYICSRIDDRGEDANFESQIGVYRGSIPTISSFNLSYEDWSHYEILQNGNAKLTFIENKKVVNPDKEDEYFIALVTYNFEYSINGKLISLNINSGIIEKEGEFENRTGILEEYNSERGYVLTYGTVDTELVESWVEVAEAKRNEQ